MAQVTQDTRSEHVSTEPLAIASCDSHIGPLMSQLREFCPKDLLDDFDAYETAFAKWRQEMMEGQVAFFGGTDNKSPEAVADGQRFASMYMRAQRTEGHYDMAARERDMDRDGVATDVIYHGSVNGQPIPFVPGGEDFFFTPTEGDLDLAAKGLHIYNEWLAEACSASPERHLGLAHVPTWNIEASVREAEWAAEHGLGGVSLPVPRPGILPYDHPDYEAFWAACEAGGLTMNSHSGGGKMEASYGPWMPCIVEIDTSGWTARRALHFLVFSGVFERHPNLHYVLSEQNGDWWPSTMREFDSAYEAHRWQLVGHMPKRPSEYCRENIFIGGSFLAHYQAEEAVRDGYASNLLWGSDYPHPEGTWQYRENDDDESMTKLALRHTFAGIPSENVQGILRDNMVRAYPRLDAQAIEKVAQRIHALSLAELQVPIDAVPDDGGFMAFRTSGPWS
jgi:predicted TIM-barrel fold metal-dependent hydrolase